METKTKELPLLRATDDGATAPLPPEVADAAFRAGETLPPRPIERRDSPPAQPEATSWPAPMEGRPANDRPAPVAQATTAPAPRAPRRWPLALGTWVGGMLAGMLILALGLGLFGGPRPLAATNTGDPAAAWDTSVTLTDAYLTAQARRNGTGQVQEPTLHIQADGTVALTGKASLLGRTVPVNATLQPTIADGKLQMPIARLSLGGLPLPEPLVNQIENSVAGATQPPAGALPTTIVRLETADGKLTLYSKVK